MTNSETKQTRSCSQCGGAFYRPGVTCGRSECQEAEHRACMERNRKPRRGAKAETACRWFLKCHNPATVNVPHPILGSVPACQRCAERATR